MARHKHRTARLFVDQELRGEGLDIAERDAHYLGHVLRLRKGDDAVVFNGRGEERRAVVASLSRKHAHLNLVDHLEPLPEPELELILVQGLTKQDAMDTIVQKAAELGVSALFTVKTDFSVIKLDEQRARRRTEHWRQVSRSACEQSGRHRPPEIVAFASLAECLAALPDGHLRVALQPGAAQPLQALDAPTSGATVLVGPEGGLSPTDTELVEHAEFRPVSLGPRVLRADTAAIVACSLVQLLWGDGRPRGKAGS